MTKLVRETVDKLSRRKCSEEYVVVERDFGGRCEFPFVRGPCRNRWWPRSPGLNVLSRVKSGNILFVRLGVALLAAIAFPFCVKVSAELELYYSNFDSCCRRMDLQLVSNWCWVAGEVRSST